MAWPSAGEVIKLKASKLVKAIKAGELDDLVGELRQLEADKARPRQSVLDALDARNVGPVDDVKPKDTDDDLAGVFERLILATKEQGHGVACSPGRVTVTSQDGRRQLVIEAGRLISTYTAQPYQLAGQPPGWRRVVERHAGPRGQGYHGKDGLDRLCADALYLFDRLD